MATDIQFDSQRSAELYTFAHQDIPSLVAHWAEKTPDKPFMIWEPKPGQNREEQQEENGQAQPNSQNKAQTWTYQRFWEEVNWVANELIEKGLKKGDKLLIHCENCPEMVLAWYASAIIGSVAVTTNTRCVGDELRYFAEHSEAKLCITQPKFIHAMQTYATTVDAFFVTGTNSDEPVTAEQQHDCASFDSLMTQQAMAPARTPEPMLPVGIQYTSGTTSRPKAVVHTHANALWAGRSGSQNLLMNSDDVYLTFLPFFHVNAQSWCFWSSLWAGSTVVFQPKFSASRFWELSMQYKCTRASMLPFCFKAIGPQEVPQHHYKTWSTGIIIKGVEDWFKVRCFATWGMTETVTHATRSDVLQDSPDMNIGVPAPGYEFAIINEQTGEYCAPDENGDLYVRGTRGIQLFYEYFKNPEAMEKSFTQDGWFKTGDRARLGSDGHFYFADRDKDVIKVGGENVSARQVEECINQLQMCFDEVAVVAQKDDMLDEVPVAFVIKSPWTDKTEEELLEMIEAHTKENLADFKRPRAVYFMDDFPRATLEKVAKNKLREIADERAKANK